MPPAGETVILPGKADADADAAVGGDDLEDDVEDGVIEGVGLELAGFGDGDEEHGEDDPPEVVGELAAELLADEVAAGFAVEGLLASGKASVGEAAFEACEEGFLWRGGGGIDGGVVGVDAEGAFLVDVGVAHRDDDGVDGDVHHDDVEDEEADAELGDVDDIEAAGADGEGLEEAVEDAEVGGDGVEGVVTDLWWGGGQCGIGEEGRGCSHLGLRRRPSRWRLGG